MPRADLLTPVVLVFLATLFFAALRKATVHPTSLQGALSTLDSIQDWTKWMAGVQTAAIAGLTYFVFEEKTTKLHQLSDWGFTFLLATYLHLGAALLVGAWVLSSMPSQTLRAHTHAAIALSSANIGPSHDGGTSPSTATPLMKEFDVYEQPIYVWTEAPRLGYLLALQHWLWVEGLLAAAGLFATLLF
ncbi:hypothetical protein [Aquabacterium sp. J223]|uniref:hypothetical protein n=1 Tax=Aquabacterium sp. J223 TaxID=2898431 RepID=UPI0021ADD3FD|nr:hypothetical protein [Aquabacterium sp. J223]UUX96954.1 hypothetical protein LRS07_06745 [Aquabacterium sp. J223]